MARIPGWLAVGGAVRIRAGDFTIRIDTGGPPTVHLCRYVATTPGHPSPPPTEVYLILSHADPDAPVP